MAYVQHREKTLEEKRTHCKPFSSYHFSSKADDDNRRQGSQSIRECTCAFKRTLSGIGVVDVYVLSAGLVRLLGIWLRIQRDPWWNGMRIAIVAKVVNCLSVLLKL